MGRQTDVGAFLLKDLIAILVDDVYQVFGDQAARQELTASIRRRQQLALASMLCCRCVDRIFEPRDAGKLARLVG